LLPTVTGNVEAMKPAKRAPDEVLCDVQATLNSMTAANWKNKRAALLATLAGEIRP
jgi:hypothetical protein